MRKLRTNFEAHKLCAPYGIASLRQTLGAAGRADGAGREDVEQHRKCAGQGTGSGCGTWGPAGDTCAPCVGGSCRAWLPTLPRPEGCLVKLASARRAPWTSDLHPTPRAATARPLDRCGGRHSHTQPATGGRRRRAKNCGVRRGGCGILHSHRPGSPGARSQEPDLTRKRARHNTRPACLPVYLPAARREPGCPPVLPRCLPCPSPVPADGPGRRAPRNLAPVQARATSSAGAASSDSRWPGAGARWAGGSAAHALAHLERNANSVGLRAS